MKFNWYDYMIFLFIIFLVITPDFTDLFDMGLPIVEPLLAVGYYIFRGGLKK